MKLTTDMKRLITENLAYIATVDNDGNPDIGPKMSIRVYDDETIVYDELTGKQTMANIENNGKAIIAVANESEMSGYRFSGPTQIIREGAFFEDATKWSVDGKHPLPKAAGVMKIEKIWTLAPGPTAGTPVTETEK
ncbi:pyridoxamine 5'-phosphate oxidase family protein [Lactococcus insecticola]|uniref:Flavin-nucleotide-binding protein n=1 Tax=Pseudolactococcus insecticola TaxID=2709158 RepID=A0A6A0B6L4_9LACT|nr:pyridoxamine 5'-phosphate oxidase family protein [Lactococcus insecticola]GFH39954.1 flavin-nucleotide-binding protein [Lactococcus insecticola]